MNQKDYDAIAEIMKLSIVDKLFLSKEDAIMKKYVKRINDLADYFEKEEIAEVGQNFYFDKQGFLKKCGVN